MIEFTARTEDPAERRAAMMNLLNAMPGRENMPDTDRNLLADLLIHALDSTVQHMMDHVKRAVPSFQSPMTAITMMPLLCSIVRMQMDGIIDDEVKRARERLIKRDGPEAFAKMHEEAKREANAVVERLRKQG